MITLVLHFKNPSAWYGLYEASVWLQPVADKLTKNRLNHTYVGGNDSNIGLSIGTFTETEVEAIYAIFGALNSQVAVLRAWAVQS